MDKVEINAHQLRPRFVLGNCPDGPAGPGPLHEKVSAMMVMIGHDARQRCRSAAIRISRISMGGM